MPTRRNVVRTAAWTVPVVAVNTAVPAWAASCGSTSTTWRLDWGNTSTTSWTQPAVANSIQTGDAVITGTTGTTPMAVTFRSQTFGSMQRDGDNLRVSSALSPAANNVGGLNQGPGLNISHASPLPSGRGNRQEIQISFSRPVTNLSFTIADTDWSNGNWDDRVELTGTRTATTNGIQGAGTQNDPWMASNGGNAGNNSGARNITVTYASLAANTAITLTFWNDSGNGNQRIFLSDLTFTASGC